MSEGGGFDFGNVKRNALLEAKGMAVAKAWKTGTTIAGMVFKVCSQGDGSLAKGRALNVEIAALLRRTASSSAQTPGRRQGQLWQTRTATK
jgi:hypothetical protein